MEHTVYFRRQPDYDQQTMDQAVESFFAASPAAARLKDGMRVTIKPNLLAKHAPEKGVTTHPALVRAVIRAVKRRGVSDITVADSPGGVYTPAIMKSIGQVSGIAQVCQEEGAVFYTDCQFGPRSCQGELVHQFNLIKPVLEADFFLAGAFTAPLVDAAVPDRDDPGPVTGELAAHRALAGGGGHDPLGGGADVHDGDLQQVAGLGALHKQGAGGRVDLSPVDAAQKLFLPGDLSAEAVLGLENHRLSRGGPGHGGVAGGHAVNGLSAWNTCHGIRSFRFITFRC